MATGADNVCPAGPRGEVRQGRLRTAIITGDAQRKSCSARTLRLQGDEKKITGRQREILQLHAEGKAMKEIAQILRLQPGTISFHKNQTMKAIGVDTNAALIQYAIDHYMVAK